MQRRHMAARALVALRGHAPACAKIHSGVTHAVTTLRYGGWQPPCRPAPRIQGRCFQIDACKNKPAPHQQCFLASVFSGSLSLAQHNLALGLGY